MKILLFQGFSLIDSNDGASKVYCNMANELYHRGHKVVCLACENKVGNPYFALDGNVVFENIGIGLNDNCFRYRFYSIIHSIINLGKNTRRALRNDFYNKDMAKRINVVLRKFTPDIIISFDEKATYNLKAYTNSNIPVVTMFHQPPEMNLERIATLVSIDKDKCMRAIEKSECLVVLLKKDIDALKKYVDFKRVEVMHNVVPQFNDSCDYNSKKIITVGRIDRRQKRTHLLIEAMKLLKGRGYDWNVEIWGDYDFDRAYYSELSEMIEKYKLNNVKFMGTSKEVINKLREASIFAFPSAYEGFPLALTEAMSMGLPCVGFKNSHAVNELIKDGYNGILCEDSIEAFADGLQELMISMDKRIEYGANAKEDMKEYTGKVIWDKWEMLIKEVVSENKLSNVNKKK